MELLDNDGPRFDIGLRLCMNIVDMIENRIKVELQIAKILQEFSSRWIKVFADGPLLKDGDFDNGTLLSAGNMVLLEANAEANLHNKVANKLADSDGPLKELHAWLKEMAESPVPPDALQLYYSAEKKQQKIEEDIHNAKMKYHCKMYKLGKIRDCMDNHHLISSIKEGIIRRKCELYSLKADNSKQKYLSLLAEEVHGRDSYLANIEEAKKQFNWFEKSHNLAIESALKKYTTILDMFDTERDEHKRILLELKSFLSKIDFVQELTAMTQKYLMKCRFPLNEELDEIVYKVPSPFFSIKIIRRAFLRWKKYWFRKKDAKHEQLSNISSSGDTQKIILPDDDDNGYITYEKDGYLQTYILKYGMYI